MDCFKESVEIDWQRLMWLSELKIKHSRNKQVILGAKIILKKSNIAFMESYCSSDLYKDRKLPVLTNY